MFASMSDGCTHCGHDWMMHTNTTKVEIACFAEDCDCQRTRPRTGDDDFNLARESGGIQFNLGALFLRMDQYAGKARAAAIARKEKE